MRVKQALDTIIQWYRDLPRGYYDINELIYKRQKLVGYLANYTDLLEELQINLAGSENQLEERKINIRVKFQDKVGIGKATSLSRQATTEESGKVNVASKQLSAMRDFIKIAIVINDTMNQHIAILRQEKKKL